MVSRFFFKPFVAIPVAPIIIGMTLVVTLYIISCILPRSFFSAPFACVPFVATSVNMDVFSFFAVIIVVGLLATPSLSGHTH